MSQYGTECDMVVSVLYVNRDYLKEEHYMVNACL